MLLIECVSSYFSGESGSVSNPFFQGVWLYLALFGLSILPGGKTTRILLSFWVMILSLITAVGAFLYLRFGLPMDCDCFFVAAASSTVETREFLERFLSWRLAAMILVLAAAGAGMTTLVWKTGYRCSQSNTAVAMLLVLPFAVNSIRYAAKGKTDRIFTRSNLPRIVSGYFLYRQKFVQLLALEKTPKLPSGIRDLGGGKGLAGVLVIGESANCSHWGVYGYPRDTTPEIRKRLGQCLIFDDVVSTHPHTTGALYHMLTNAELVSGKAPDFTMVDILKATGMRVVMISNQMRWGKYDGPISILTAHCDKRLYLRDLLRKPYDFDVIPVLEKILKEFSRERLLVIVHLMGSHNRFSLRYPQDFSRFDGVVDGCTRDLQKKVADELNEYDNSIAYTDRVLGAVADLLQKESRPAFMFYVSDHSETGAWAGHPAGRSPASKIPDVYEVPCLLWTNLRYRSAHPDVLAAAGRNLSAPMQGDRLIWPILSASRITFDQFPQTKNIFSTQYIPAEKRLTGGVIYSPSKEKLEARRARAEAKTH